jgi:hypothetical protein
MPPQEVQLCKAVEFLEEMGQALFAAPRRGVHADAKVIVEVAFELVEFRLHG